MNHLSDNELMLLAETTIGLYPYDDNQLKQMDHLKECSSCYEEFCSLLAILEVTSEQGYTVLSEMYNMQSEVHQKEQSENKVIAAINIIASKLKENINTAFEQIEFKKSCLFFQPDFAAASRGIGTNEQTVYKLIDIEDENTFIAMDIKSHKILVQVNAKPLEQSNIQIYVKSNNDEIIEIPLTKQGEIYKGISTEIHFDSFQVIIEQIN